VNDETAQREGVGLTDSVIVKALHLQSLEEGAPGITREWGVSLAQAAAVCLEEVGHSPDIALRVDGGITARFRLSWIQPTEQTLRCFADSDEATEFGACAIAIVLVHELTTLTVFERSRKGKGFDYWLAEKGNNEPLFQEKTRLEISGLRRGETSEVSSREHQKIAQVKRYETDSTRRLPAIVVIVEFGAPRSRFVRL
jgi:hypothetical protein